MNKNKGAELYRELLKDNKGPMYQEKWEALLLEAYNQGSCWNRLVVWLRSHRKAEKT